MKDNELKVGDVFHDINHKWTDGSNDLDFIHILLSMDRDIEDGIDYWKLAGFMWSAGYCGASIRKFTEQEVLKMKRIGNIESIKRF